MYLVDIIASEAEDVAVEYMTTHSYELDACLDEEDLLALQNKIMNRLHELVDIRFIHSHNDTVDKHSVLNVTDEGLQWLDEEHELPSS